MARLFSRYSTPISLGLGDQGQAKNRPCVGADGGRDPRQNGDCCGGIAENDALSRGAQDIVKHPTPAAPDAVTRLGRASATAIVSPPIVASASIRSWAPRGTINRPRLAPACSMAVRISVSISISRTISPETACDNLDHGREVEGASTGRPRSCSSVREPASSSLRCGYISSSCRTLPSAPQRR